MKTFKSLLKHIFTAPMVLFHMIKGIDEPYEALVSFFRYFPLASINKDKSVNIKYRNHRLKFYYDPLAPVPVGEFAIFDYRDLQVKNKTVVDIGIGLGDTPIIFILEGAKKVIGFDLNKRYLEIASKNILENGFQDKVQLNYAGVSSKKIHSTDEILGALMMDCDINEVEDASFKTLEEITNNIDDSDPVLKIDVDGYEYEILSSTDSRILNKYSQIILEYHFGVKNIENLLTKAGFSISIKPVAKCYVENHPDAYRNMDIGIISAHRKFLID